MIARVFAALLTGTVFSQSVEFTQQYLQRLGGAVDEIEMVVARFDAGAARAGVSRDAALKRLRGNSDPLAARQGEDAAATILRSEELARRYRDLVDAAPLLRPFVALGDLDWAITARAGDDYRPALPITIDGFVLTATGFGLGWAFGASAHGAARMGRRRSRRQAREG
ncbi:DUF2937 family protein [Aurantimonas sp. C2-6-R+9]|uniref:DUF2937 family protein n=1 Tax=unclassified Aurantimonas TaxID=2638230 RepID=UPI002E16C26A|nr:MULTISPECIES: DUF2937 family protein [unclassified Aurantimonas]MEC5289578.1 DUF2937 family protein [Aurantimonas sp. C2-3-R2]MEC5379543.1 DUF2937 family protein [Aurantimonas sp. C2-6-R+9]MEC5410659.1 DUF2937 family protein [Aurantimonas sp. C2-4-R8]